MKSKRAIPAQVQPVVMPVLLSKRERREFPACPNEIPMKILDEVTAMQNHSQTLLRLAERGGLSPCEMLAVMDHRPWKPMNMEMAIVELMNRVKA